MPIFGRKPSGRDSGIGDCGTGDMRSSIMGKLTSHGWLTRFGGRIGKNPSDVVTPTGQFAIYQATTSSVGARVGTSGTFSVTTIMADNASGTDITSAPSAPIPMTANQQYALALRAQGDIITHGQDMSGWTMYRRIGVGTSFPTPFGTTASSPEGKMSLWGEVTTNRRPNTPTIVTPAPGSITVSTLPAMAANFSDPDEVLPGFSLGQCDKLGSYSFEIWNSTKTVRLKSSGILTANSTQQTARKATWTPTGTALPAASYVARAIVYDYFGTPSATAEWTFTVSSGGVPTNVDIATAAYVVPGITNLTAPDMTGIWTSSSGLSTTKVTVQLINATGGTVARGPYDATVTVAPGGAISIAFAATGWSALTPGSSYFVQMRGTDTASLVSPWASGPAFKVNATPAIPSFRTPASGAFTSRPNLQAWFTDATDDSSLLTPEIAVRPLGDTGSGVSLGAYAYLGSGYWVGATTATSVPSLGNYEWRCRATDPQGLVGGWSSWLPFSYVLPPAVAVTNPTDGSTITNGTPTITWTVDRAMTSFQVQLFDGVTPVWDSLLITSSVPQVTVPAAKLYNGTTLTMRLTVTTADGLQAIVTTTFTVAYVPPTALAGLSVVKARGQYEPLASSVNWSQIAVSWTAVSTGTVSDADFGGYVLRRVDNSTGLVDLTVNLLTRDENAYLDATPRSRTTYTYNVSYLKLVNNLQYIESTVAAGDQSVTLACSTITSLEYGDTLSVPMMYWTERSARLVNDIEVVETWGDKPFVFQGVLNYTVLAGTFTLLDDPEGNYTNTDLVATLRTLAVPASDDDGTLRPRTICYRDPKKRVLICSITSLTENDNHLGSIASVDLTLTENATDVSGVVL